MERMPSLRIDPRTGLGAAEPIRSSRRTAGDESYRLWRSDRRIERGGGAFGRHLSQAPRQRGTAHRYLAGRMHAADGGAMADRAIGQWDGRAAIRRQASILRAARLLSLSRRRRLDPDRGGRRWPMACVMWRDRAR